MRRLFAALAAVALTALPAAGQWPRGPFAETHALVRSYQGLHGRPPGTLQDLCEILRGAIGGCAAALEAVAADDWRRPLRIEPAAGDTAYALRSAGPDGVMETADDLRSPNDALGARPLLRSAAGCYRWLRPVDRRMRRLARDVPTFRLDTLAGMDAETGDYELRPRWPAAREDEEGGERKAAWRPIPPDTLALFWGSAFHGLSLRFVVRGDTLRGSVGFYSDSHPPRDTNSRPDPLMQAVRVRCAP